MKHLFLKPKDAFTPQTRPKRKGKFFLLLVIFIAAGLPLAYVYLESIIILFNQPCLFKDVTITDIGGFFASIFAGIVVVYFITILYSGRQRKNDFFSSRIDHLWRDIYHKIMNEVYSYHQAKRNTDKEFTSRVVLLFRLASNDISCLENLERTEEKRMLGKLKECHFQLKGLLTDGVVMFKDKDDEFNQIMTKYSLVRRSIDELQLMLK